MAREASITSEQVAAVAAELKAQGVRPTVRAIRDALGAGSMTTLTRLLQRWHDAQPAATAPAIDIPAGVLQGIRQAISQAAADAEAGLRAELAEARQMLSDVTVESERTAEALEAADERLASLDSLQAGLSARIEELEKARTEREASCTAQIAELKLEIERERQAAEASRVEHAKDKLRLEAMPRLEADLETAREASKTAQERLVTAERELAGVRASLKALEADLERERQAVVKLDGALEQSRAKTDALSAKLSEVSGTAQSQKVALEASSREIAGLQERVRELKEELAVAKKVGTEKKASTKAKGAEA